MLVIHSKDIAIAQSCEKGELQEVDQKKERNQYTEPIDDSHEPFLEKTHKAPQICTNRKSRFQLA
jgi:hypothetical protein